MNNKTILPLKLNELDSDTVSRQTAIRALRDTFKRHTTIAIIAMQTIKDLPSAPSRPKGQWIKEKMWSEGIGMGESYGFNYSCSECKKVVKGGYNNCGKNFCPNCGADMR